MEEAAKQLEEGRLELENARAELEDGWSEYFKGKAEGEQKLADARKEWMTVILNCQMQNKLSKKNERNLIRRSLMESGKLQMQRRTCRPGKPEWYCLERSSNPGYTDYAENTDKIAAISKVFPVLFFAVAALVCLTSMTRMVEEHRTQNGTMKALAMVHCLFFLIT